MANVMSSRASRPAGSREVPDELLARSRSSASRNANQVPFSYQPQETPLDRDALYALDTLRKSAVGANRISLQTTHEEALKAIHDVTGQLYDRLIAERTREENRRNKALQKGEDPESDTQSKERLAEFEARIAKCDEQLDNHVRQIVDHKKWLKTLPESIKYVLDKSREIKARYDEDPDTGRGQDGDGQMEEVDEQPARKIADSEQASTILQAATSTAEIDWNSKTLTEKYSNDASYADFYKLRWDAKHPQENAPPHPPPNSWFAAEEGRGRGRRQATQAVDETENVGSDTEIQIASESVSCKCPLTLEWFTEPVTSTKCPHSFQKTAIQDVISQSTSHVPLNDEQMAQLNERHPPGSRGRPQAEAAIQRNNPRFVKCPVCEMQLTFNDLRDDPVLLRKTMRMRGAHENAQRDEEESSDEEDDFIRGTQRPTRPKRPVVHVGSSPATERRRTLIKGERRIDIVPQSPSQRQTQGRRRVADIDDEDELMAD